MPRGFLVKRSKRASAGSYRMRPDCAEMQKSEPHAPKSEPPRDPVRAPCTDGTAARTLHAQPQEPSALAPRRSIFHSTVSDKGEDDDVDDGDGDDGEGDHVAEKDCHRPAVPLSAGLKRSPFPRCLSSPAAAESFPVSSIERLLLSSQADIKFTSCPASFPHNLKPETKSKPPGRKLKVARKLTFEDEVTTSPVLGLRIKKESPDSAPRPSKKPLGEFICQLCKEEYPDPFSLAQHRCSRIVRVEYRCPECDKVFSCPANLASHRRWHKPRDTQDTRKSQVHEKASVEGKENATDMRVKQQQHQQQHQQQQQQQHQQQHQQHHPHPQLQQQQQQHQLLFFSTEGAQSSVPTADTHCGAAERRFDDVSRMFERRRDDTDPLAPGFLCARAGGERGREEEEEEYACHYCAKKFRRHAYLRKHLAAHQSVHAASYKHAESAPIPFTCHLCGARFPTAEVREKHRLWHALAGPVPGKTAGALIRADLMLPPKPSRIWEVPT